MQLTLDYLVIHSFRQPQAISCSRITQHASVTPHSDRPPDAAWTTGPEKYLPKKTEVQSPEAAAAAKETIKKVLESRICDSAAPKSLRSTTGNTSPLSLSKTLEDKLLGGTRVAGQTENLLSPTKSQRTDISQYGNCGNAAKERFMNALARFQKHDVAKSGQLAFEILGDLS